MTNALMKRPRRITLDDPLLQSEYAPGNVTEDLRLGSGLDYGENPSYQVDWGSILDQAGVGVQNPSVFRTTQRETSAPGGTGASRKNRIVLEPLPADRPEAKPGNRVEISDVESQPEQSQKKSGWHKAAEVALAVAPTLIGGVIAGKQGALAGAKGTVEGIRKGQEDRESRAEKERLLTLKNRELDIKAGDQKTGQRDKLLALAEDRKADPQALKGIAKRLKDAGFAEDALLLESDAVAATTNADSKRREIQRNRLLDLAKDRKDNPAALSQIGEKLKTLGFAEDANLVAQDATFATTQATQKNETATKKDQAATEKASKAASQSQLDGLMRLKKYPEAAAVARQIGQEDLATALENTKTGPDERLVESVRQNPVLFGELPPTMQAELIVPLSDKGFNFAGALDDPNKRLQLIRSYASLKGMTPQKAAQLVDGLMPAPSPGGGGADGNAGGVSTEQKISKAMEVLKLVSKEDALKEIRASHSLTSTEKAEVAKRLGIPWGQ